MAESNRMGVPTVLLKVLLGGSDQVDGNQLEAWSRLVARPCRLRISRGIVYLTLGSRSGR